MTQQNKVIAKPQQRDESAVEFVPFGANDAIRLTASMIRQFIAIPTRSGALPSERDCIRFIMLCKGKRANPFEGDCWLIGYDTQQGAAFSLVCGQDLFLKRAEQSADYDGIESGVILLADGQIHERGGSLVLDGETLVGGWAKVYRKNHDRPEYKTVKLTTYDTGKSRWAKDAGGMIEKVARSQALRAAYPTVLGGLYAQEEMEKLTQAGDTVTAGARTPIAEPRALAAPTQELPAETETPEPAHDAPLTQQDHAPAQEEETEPAPAGERVVGLLQSTSRKDGETNGQPWTRYGVKVQHEWFGTFDTAIWEAAEGLKGQRVVLTVRRDGKHADVTGIGPESE